MPITPRLRIFAAGDREPVLDLNELEVQHLAPLDGDHLDRLLRLVHRFLVIEVEGAFAGFVVTVAPGSTYDSPNYRWFAEQYADRFYYLDRIVLRPEHRRRGIGAQVYDELEVVATPYGRMALEVSLDPPNTASLAFHAARGYVEVGRRGAGTHPVSLMVKELDPAASRARDADAPR